MFCGSSTRCRGIRSVFVVFPNILTYFFLGRKLTHTNLVSFCGTWANCAEPDQIPQSVASDPGLHCLLTECSI